MSYDHGAWRLASVLVVVFIVQVSLPVHSAPLDFVKGAVKTVANKAADVADKTEPAAENGGVRAAAMHTGANLIVDKGLDVIGRHYPLAAPVMPFVKKLAKPAIKKVHEKINSIGKKDEEAKDAQIQVEEVKKDNVNEGAKEEKENELKRGDEKNDKKETGAESGEKEQGPQKKKARVEKKKKKRTPKKQSKKEKQASEEEEEEEEEKKPKELDETTDKADKAKNNEEKKVNKKKAEKKPVDSGKE